MSLRPGRGRDERCGSFVNGVRVIVMPDHRLPLVTWNLTTRAGSHADAKGKEGLSDLADSMIRRGAGLTSFPRLRMTPEA